MAVNKGTNSYATLQESGDYFENNLSGEAWTLETPARRGIALTTASPQVSRLLKAEFQLPYADPSLIPAMLQAAIFELALAMLLDTSIVVNSGGADADVKKVSAGPVDVEFFSSSDSEAPKRKRFPPNVQEILELSEYLEVLIDPDDVTIRSGIGGLAGGTNTASYYDNNVLAKSQGYL